MGGKIAAGYLATGKVNELDLKGIPRNANDSSVDPNRKEIPKVTNADILNYGRETLDKMQKEHLDALTAEHLALGSQEDRTLEQARLE